MSLRGSWLWCWILLPIAGCGQDAAGTESMLPAAVSCAPGLSPCAAACVDQMTSAAHCGGCFQACAGSCASGVCQDAVAGPASTPNGAGGTSGVTALGGATASTGGSGALPPETAPGVSEVDGYLMGAAYRGYVFTEATGTGTIEPAELSARDFPLCVKGSVAPGYDQVALVGWNLREDATSGAGAMAITPKAAGFQVRVSNPGGSPLRLQIQAPGGDSDPKKRYCAPLTEGATFVPLSAFNTECWPGGVGAAYGGEPITSAMVLVPGQPDGPLPFDFCWEAFAEADGPADADGGSSTDATDGSGEFPQFEPLSGGCSGWATRYWDCCKPHCGWTGNVPGGVSPLAACSQQDQSLGANYDARNSCEGGPAYMCMSMAPWAVSDRLSYGFAAVSAGGDVCGKCYQLQFSGTSHSAGNDPGSHAIAGKTMIVQVTNVGGDVGGTQFDLLIPGGGVGLFNACSGQWGASGDELGEQYGGLLSRCQRTVDREDHAGLKRCVLDRCTQLFDSRGLTDLYAGCQWFTEWFEVADNPDLLYAEVPCPAALSDRGMRRNGGAAGGCL